VAAPPTGPRRHAVSPSLTPSVPPSSPNPHSEVRPTYHFLPTSLPPSSTEHTEAKIDITLPSERQLTYPFLPPSLPPSLPLPPSSTEHTEAKIDITLLLEDEAREAHAAEGTELEEDEEVGEDEREKGKEGGARGSGARMFCAIM